MELRENIFPNKTTLVGRKEREKLQFHSGHVLWFTGLSGSGKSTIARMVERDMFDQGYRVVVLDGDNIRLGISSDLGFNIIDRKENLRRTSEIARLFLESGMIVLVSFITPTHEVRKMVLNKFDPKDFSLCYVEASIERCEQRDVKGLYEKARSGEIKDFTGISASFDIPIYADLILNTDDYSPEQSSREALIYLKEKSSR